MLINTSLYNHCTNNNTAKNGCSNVCLNLIPRGIKFCIWKPLLSLWKEVLCDEGV